MTRQIIGDISDRDMGCVASKVEAAKPNYAALIARYRTAPDKKLFFERDISGVAHFLNDCRLIGAKGEREEVSMHSYVIGAEGLALISAYLQNKEKHSDLPHHPVRVIKNEDLVAKDGSRKNAKIALDTKHVHTALHRELCDDLRDTDELTKTYVIETFGTTGGNHFVALTVKKDAGSDASPIIYLFDPSPALTRNGMEAGENSIANGYCAQIAINATLKRALTDIGLHFDTNRYYNNSEPLQMGGPVLCGTFALEEAHRISREGFDPAPFKFKSVFGGWTEIPALELLTKDGYLGDHPPLRLPISSSFISHFTDTALRSREQEMRNAPHKTKSGADEMIWDRVRRYQLAAGENSIAEQKSLRQKYAHLFEIVISDAFVEKCRTMPRLDLPDFNGSPYFAADKDVENSNPATKQLVAEFNKILPRFNRVSDVTFDGKNAEMVIFIGKTTARKIANQSDPKSFGYRIKDIAQVESTEVRFDNELSDIDPQFSCLTKLVVRVSKEKFLEFISAIEVEKKENGMLYKARTDHPFTPPRATTPLGGTSIQSDSEKSQGK